MYEICDLSLIQMSFRRKIAPQYCDKKIEHLCYIIFRSCISILINTKGCQPYNVLSCKNFHHTFSSWDVVNQSSTSYKLPLYFLGRSFWTLYWCWMSYYSFCLSSDLLSSLFWTMHIKTRCSSMKDYHCLKYTHLEHTVISL